jgi:hypothetical protein
MAVQFFLLNVYSINRVMQEVLDSAIAQYKAATKRNIQVTIDKENHLSADM